MNFLYGYTSIIPASNEMYACNIPELAKDPPYANLGGVESQLNQMVGWQPLPRPDLLIQLDEEERRIQETPEEKELDALRKKMTLFDCTALITTLPSFFLHERQFRIRGRSSTFSLVTAGVFSIGTTIFGGLVGKRWINAQQSGKKAHQPRLNRLRNKVRLIETVIKELEAKRSEDSQVELINKQLNIARQAFEKLIVYYENNVKQSPPCFNTTHGSILFDEKGIVSSYSQGLDIHTTTTTYFINKPNGLSQTRTETRTYAVPNGKTIYYNRDN